MSSFRDAVLSALGSAPDYIEPGRLHRFPGNGKRRGNTAGWCILSADGQVGSFGDFSTGIEGKWRTDDMAGSSAEWRRQAQEARRAARENRRREQQQAAAKARAIWLAASPCGDDHAYLVRKGIKAHGMRVDRHGNLVVPVYVRRALVSLQLIAPDGSKRFLRGGRTQGGYCPISGDRSSVILCEGFATGATLAEATGHFVVVAFNAGNLQSVAEYTRRQFPSGDIVVAADNDRATTGNPGLQKATEAARAIHARLAVPDFPPHVDGSDFNDLAALSRASHG